MKTIRAKLPPESIIDRNALVNYRGGAKFRGVPIEITEQFLPPGSEIISGRTERCEKHNVVYFPGEACGLCVDEVPTNLDSQNSKFCQALYEGTPIEGFSPFYSTLDEQVTDDDAIMAAIRAIARSG
jgi:hypothetical protein